MNCICMKWKNKKVIVTVHSVHSNVAKIHSRLPAAMGFWLVCFGIVVCEQEQVISQLQRKKDKWYDEAEKWRYDRLCKSQKAEKSTLTSM